MDLKETGQRNTARHPWEVARAAFFRRLLSERGVLRDARAVLDVGAGDGYVASALAAAMPSDARVICFDAHYTDEHLARPPDDPRVQRARDEPPGPFDLLLCLDVLEHVPDDRAFLAGLAARALRQAGVVLVSVPAWPALYTRHDVALGHHRRYRRAQLARVVTDAGLHVEASGDLFHSLLVARALQKAAEVAGGTLSRPGADGFGVVREGEGLGAWTAGPLATRLVSAVLRLDGAASRHVSARRWPLPGLSTWVLARR